MVFFQVTVNFKFYPMSAAAFPEEMEQTGCVEETSDKAQNSAAVKALRCLEVDFNIKVVDFSVIRLRKVKTESESILTSLHGIRPVLLSIGDSLSNCVDDFKVSCDLQLKSVVRSIREGIGERTGACGKELSDKLDLLYASGDGSSQECKEIISGAVVRLVAAEFNGISVGSENHTEASGRDAVVDLKQICAWVVKDGGSHGINLTTNVLVGGLGIRTMFQCEAFVYRLHARAVREDEEFHVSGKVCSSESEAEQSACYRALLAVEGKLNLRVVDYHEDARRVAEEGLDDLENIHEECLRAAYSSTNALKVFAEGLKETEDLYNKLERESIDTTGNEARRCAVTLSNLQRDCRLKLDDILVSLEEAGM